MREHQKNVLINKHHSKGPTIDKQSAEQTEIKLADPIPKCTAEQLERRTSSKEHAGVEPMQVEEAPQPGVHQYTNAEGYFCLYLIEVILSPVTIWSGSNFIGRASKRNCWHQRTSCDFPVTIGNAAFPVGGGTKYITATPTFCFGFN